MNRIESKKICMIADGHHLYDDRMYWKQALSLQKAGYELSIIFTSNVDEKGITEHGILFYGVKIRRYFKSKFLNFFPQLVYHKTNSKILKIAREIQADVYHLHDYQQRRIAERIKSFAHEPRIIFDARIPLEKNISDFSVESGIKNFLVKKYASFLQQYEYKTTTIYDVVLTVDDGVFRSFEKNGKYQRLETVYNFTNLDARRSDISLKEKEYDLICVGGLTELRGFYIMLRIGKALAKRDIKLLLLGKIFDEKLKTDLFDFVKDNNLESNIFWVDQVRFDVVSDYYNSSKIGLNILLPAKAHEDIIQIKLFEYMNFGLPIITSNFGEMKKYVEMEQVGFAVDPFDENEIISKIEEVLDDEKLYTTFSQNGKKAVDEKYNWMIMEKKLLKIYSEL